MLLYCRNPVNTSLSTLPSLLCFSYLSYIVPSQTQVKAQVKTQILARIVLQRLLTPRFLGKLIQILSRFGMGSLTCNCFASLILAPSMEM